MKVTLTVFVIIFFIAFALFVYDSGIPAKCPKCGSPMKRHVTEEGEVYVCEKCGNVIMIGN